MNVKTAGQAVTCTYDFMDLGYLCAFSHEFLHGKLCVTLDLCGLVSTNILIPMAYFNFYFTFSNNAPFGNFTIEPRGS